MRLAPSLNVRRTAARQASAPSASQAYSGPWLGVTGRSVAWPPVPVMMWPPVNTRGAGIAFAALHSLKQIRGLADAVHVPDRGEARFQVAPQVALAPQHAVPFTGLLVDRRAGIRIREVDVHVDEAGHHGLARDIDHLRIGRPAFDLGRQHGFDGVASMTTVPGRTVPLTASNTRPPRSTICCEGPAGGLAGMRRGSSVVCSVGASTVRRSWGAGSAPARAGPARAAAPTTADKTHLGTWHQRVRPDAFAIPRSPGRLAKLMRPHPFESAWRVLAAARGCARIGSSYRAPNARLRQATSRGEVRMPHNVVIAPGRLRRLRG